MSAGSEPAGTLRVWRAFPWDRNAPDGAPFSMRSVPAPERQTSGRFDLGPGYPSVLYTAETAEHAISELLQEFRGQRLLSAHLRKHGFPVALVEITVPAEVARRIPDLGDPGQLLRFGVRADTLALPESMRRETQEVVRRIYRDEDDLPGFRWWSALHGAWHGTVLFVDRVPLDTLLYGESLLLTTRHPAVRAAAASLGMLRRRVG